MCSEKLMANKLVRKVGQIIQTNKKKIYQASKADQQPKSILFIVGCQRSGTTIMQEVFDQDLNTRVFGEFSELSSNDTVFGIRLNSLELVEEEFAKISVPFIVSKPLVESSRTLELLGYFKGSRALWMFRNYRDVTLSNIKHFGLNNGIDDLRGVFNNEPGNWRAEGLSDAMREMVATYFSEEMNPYDAAVLFWITRNSLFFDLGLDQHPDVLMCNYNDLVTQPERFLRYLYQRSGQIFPAGNITAAVHANSLEKGADLDLSPEVEQLARAMMDRLVAAYRLKTLF